MLNDEVVKKHLPEGRYAIAMHKGSREKIGATYCTLLIY